MLTLYKFYIGRLPFSRSYGDILPSSLTRVLPSTLEFSSRLPVSVYGTGTSDLARSFSWQCGVNKFTVFLQLPVTSWTLRHADLPACHPTGLDAYTNNALACPPASLHCSNDLLVVLEYQPAVHRLRILPRLRSRLTLRRRALLRKP